MIQYTVWILFMYTLFFLITSLFKMTFGLNSDCESTFYQVIILKILIKKEKRHRKYRKLTATADGRRTLLDAKIQPDIFHDYMLIPFFIGKKTNIYISQTQL